jgi:hypothetical protein
MSDARFAVAASKDMLVPSGVFLMDDHVGATYNQHAPMLYDLAHRLRAKLPSSWFVGSDAIPLNLGRYAVDDVIASDPTEAADSANILPALAEHLPGVSIVPMGGVFYLLAAREAFGRFEEANPSHVAILEAMFEY